MNSSVVQPQIEESWKKVLAEEFSAEYFASLKSFLLEEKEKYRIYPPGKEIFSAFNLTPFEEVKVVIIGQDPYHGPGQAHGLCFSVRQGVAIPPSLLNVKSASSLTYATTRGEFVRVALERGDVASARDGWRRAWILSPEHPTVRGLELRLLDAETGGAGLTDIRLAAVVEQAGTPVGLADSELSVA